MVIKLPVCDLDIQNQLEEMGVIFGNIIEDDSLFMDVDLPDGWSLKKAYPMWWDLKDGTGKKVAEMFYKSEDYDRRAFLRLV